MKKKMQSKISLKLQQNSKIVWKKMAEAARKTSSFWSNFPCSYWNYEPKMPKSVKEMRKF